MRRNAKLRDRVTRRDPGHPADPVQSATDWAGSAGHGVAMNNTNTSDETPLPDSEKNASDDASSRSSASIPSLSFLTARFLEKGGIRGRNEQTSLIPVSDWRLDCNLANRRKIH